jgi:hypothetical protein
MNTAKEATALDITIKILNMVSPLKDQKKEVAKAPAKEPVKLEVLPSDSLPIEKDTDA